MPAAHFQFLDHCSAFFSETRACLFHNCSHRCQPSARGSTLVYCSAASKSPTSTPALRSIPNATRASPHCQIEPAPAAHPLLPVRYPYPSTSTGTGTSLTYRSVPALCIIHPALLYRCSVSTTSTPEPAHFITNNICVAELYANLVRVRPRSASACAPACQASYPYCLLDLRTRVIRTVPLIIYQQVRELHFLIHRQLQKHSAGVLRPWFTSPALSR